MKFKKANIIVRNTNDLKKYVDYVEELEQQCKQQKEVINKLELENKVLKEQMVAMVKPNYTYGIR